MARTQNGSLRAMRLLALACAAALSVPMARGEGAVPEPMRMLTFNIYSDWHVAGGGVKPREAGIEKALKKLRPDVAALQEVCVNWWASPMFSRSLLMMSSIFLWEIPI